MTDIETVVIGAGVVGLATGAALAASGQEVMVLEREAAIGQGISARNSEVIHAGIYYATNSLKAQLCVRGKALLYEYCHARNIPHNRLGKLIVATSPQEIDSLRTLQHQALCNHVEDTVMLNARDAGAMQPELNCIAALHSPSTGVIDSHSFMLSLQSDIERHQGLVVCNTTIEALQTTGSRLKLITDDGTTIHTKQVVNCAGLNAVSLAQTTNSIDISILPNMSFAKGNYFKLATKAPFNQLIYPAPVVGGLGIHLTIDLAGQMRFGPDVEWLEADQSALNKFDYNVDPARATSFYAAIRKYWPNLPDNSLAPDYAGIRPKIARDGKIKNDFEFSTEQQHGIPGLVNIFGIESPGLTSSLAIAELVRNYL